MNAYPGPYSVLVVDNASIHKGQYLLDICNSKGVRIEFLPPYSPDLNPVYNIMFLFIILFNFFFIFKTFIY